MRKRTALTAALAAIMLLSGCGSKVTATEPKEVGKAENSTYSSEDVNVDAESSEESSSSDLENPLQSESVANDADSSSTPETVDPIIEVTDDIKGQLDALETDYNKINWERVSTPFEEKDIVVSTIRYQEGNNHYLIVGITNLSDIDVWTEGWGFATDIAGNTMEDEDVSLHILALAPGQTSLQQIPFGFDVPSGEVVDWQNVEIKESYWDYASPSTFSWSLEPDEDDWVFLNFDVQGDVMEDASTFQFVVFDKEGNIIDYRENTKFDVKPEWKGRYSMHLKKDENNIDHLAVFVQTIGDKR